MIISNGIMNKLLNNEVGDFTHAFCNMLDKITILHCLSWVLKFYFVLIGAN